MFKTSKSDFKLKFEFRDDDKKRWYTLKNPLKWKDIVVPPNIFFTDLCTVPYLLQWLFKPNGKYGRSGVVHDFLYGLKHIKRLRCDIEFFKCMRADGVNLFTSCLFFLAVRVGGGFYR